MNASYININRKIRQFNYISTMHSTMQTDLIVLCKKVTAKMQSENYNQNKPYFNYNKLLSTQQK